MLHAFDINTGDEKWAFIPNNLLPKLKDLTLLDYCHEYFVDLSPRVAEVFVGGVYKKILIGGERGGGNSFFALDITDPSAAGVQPMWQFSDPYLGESWTIPSIEKCFLDGQERLVAFIGSSYGNKDTKGYLFAVDVLTGEKMGTELVLTGAPDNVMPSLRAIDWDQDGYADRIFVGCLQEKLFVVEIGPGANPKFWKSQHILSTEPGQPISVPTSLSLYREAGVDHVMSYFGTGKFYTLADKTDLTLQTFYAVKDNAVKAGKGGLADQTNADMCAPLLGGFGWYIDLVEGPGERVVSSSLVIGGYVFFATFQPSDNPCEAGGIARLYVINYDNGCVPAAPVVDINGDGVVDENDKIGGKIPRTIEIGYGVPSDIIFDPAESSIIIQTSDTTIHVFKVDVMKNRLTVHSWREVID
jgi:type IV pilus assembly protein PilY1